MTTATYTTTVDLNAEEYPYLVLDPDGDVADEFKTLFEAENECERLNAELREERDEAEADALRAEIELAIQYAPLSELRKIAEVVLKARGI